LVSAVDVEEESTETTTAQTVIASQSGYTLSDKAVRISYDGGSFIVNYSPVTLSSSTGVIDLGEMAYRGKIEITASDGVLDTVNILTMDQYLYGVVPSEVYAEWPEEALKAQAVAARTYAQYHIGKHSGYDLCDHTHCQQYSGYNKEETSTNRAVDATSGVIAYYNGRPINSVYYDCDGGYTLSAEEVWGSDIPYLQSTPDPYELNARKWERSFTLDEIGKLMKDSGNDIGNVTNVAITKKRGDILAEEVVITGTNGSFTLTGQDIKTFFKQDGENLWSRCFTISGSSAPSNNIYVESADGKKDELGVSVVSAVSSGGEVTVLDDINLVLRGKNGDVVLSPEGGRVTEAADSIVFSGAGWGHGVGMSQCGAYGMASQGYDYKEILKYYYKGI
ncbi:MAG: SpoIID/LytB domain-containing protein, partial [Firmicutes bacterium]|nr:SpoIID/LytB domain-containing protein [Bacillota bacterium]